MSTDGQDKTLPATPRRIQKAREEGTVARSRDLGHFAIIAVGGALLVFGAPQIGGWLQATLAEALRFDVQAVASPAAMLERLGALTLKLMLVIVPLGVIMAAAVVAANVGSGGWNWTTKALMPKFEKLNPLSGIGRIFSKDNLTTTLKACLLALVIGTIGAFFLYQNVARFMEALAMPLPTAMSHSVSALAAGGVLMVIALALFAAIDVPLQRKLMLDRLKMSHQEVKQEHKEVEGNMEVKAKVRARMREMAKRRMLAAVPTADLVVMNPTHYAVALKYDEATMAAPRVVAKGTDLVALRIRDLAKESKVPVLEAPPLARALYAHSEIDGEVPAALFAAVAQVLAHVYQLRAAVAGRAPMPGELPALKVPQELDPHTHKGGGAAPA